MTTPERAAELFYRHHVGYTQAVALMMDMYGMTANQARNIIHATPCWEGTINPPDLSHLRPQPKKS